VKRARVVHVVVAGEVGGAERMLVELASRPDASGAEHVVALMTPSEALARMLAAAGLRVVDRGRVRENPAAFLWRSLGPGDVAWLASVIERERADVAHLHTFGSQVVGTRAARRAGARVVRTEHSTRVYDDPSCWPFSRWSLRRADAVVAISEHVKRVALAKAPWKKRTMRVVRNGVDVARFVPRDAPEHGPASAARFVVVGRLEPRKGIDLAIDALAEAPGVELDVVGDGQDRASLEAHARKLRVTERVCFHGRVEDTRDLIASADAALCSSRTEGLGIALLEAMAMAKPVVGFAVGGVPEIVEDGATGLLTRTSTASSLATRMREAAADRDRLRALGRAARAWVERHASVDAMCAAYGAIYERLAADGPL
jgi:glycosyltransferase involved in cell wall biosynthesis